MYWRGDGFCLSLNRLRRQGDSGSMCVLRGQGKHKHLAFWCLLSCESNSAYVLFMLHLWVLVCSVGLETSPKGFPGPGGLNSELVNARADSQ